MVLTQVSQTLIMGSTFGLAFSISHFNFFCFDLSRHPSTSKGHLTDEQLMTIILRICHFLLHEYISPCGAYHTLDGHIAYFPVLCDDIQQG
jgi:hypothetical protein